LIYKCPNDQVVVARGKSQSTVCNHSVERLMCEVEFFLGGVFFCKQGARFFNVVP